MFWLIKFVFFYVIPLGVTLKFLRYLYMVMIVERERRRFLKKFEAETKKGRGRETRVIVDKKEYPEAVVTISRSLKDDPISFAMVKNPTCPEERKEFIQGIVNVQLKYLIPLVTVTKDDEGGVKGDVRCVACWFFSGHSEGFGIIVAFFFLLLRLFGIKKTISTLSDYLTLEGNKKEIMKDQMKKGFYYLGDLGADPAFQGKGYGSDTIDLVHRVADKEGRSCYLESTNPRNHTFYKRHGYKVMKEVKLLGVVVTSFRRDCKKMD